MPETLPRTAVLPSLGRLVRGLAILFWLLPLALVSYVQTARTNWLFFIGPFSALPPLITSSLLLYALHLMGAFQPQERIWIQSLDRARMLALVNVGLSPFLFWWHKVPENFFFQVAVAVLTVAGLGLPFGLNIMLHRLSAMLPDETLRAETRLFTSFNRGILFTIPFFILGYGTLLSINKLPPELQLLLQLAYHYGLWLSLALVLVPLSVTMAMIWKIKEAVFTSVFEGQY